MSIHCLLGSITSGLMPVVRCVCCVWLLQKESFVLFSLAIWKLDSLFWFVVVWLSDTLVFLIGFSGYVNFLNEWIDFFYVFWKIISSWFYKHRIYSLLLFLPFRLLLLFFYSFACCSSLGDEIVYASQTGLWVVGLRDPPFNLNIPSRWDDKYVPPHLILSLVSGVLVTTCLSLDGVPFYLLHYLLLILFHSMKVFFWAVRKGFIEFKHLHCCLLLKEFGTGIQIGHDSGGRP